ncbi:hypothetical protein AMECASPLE_006975 [Ameca splendens]|uniref:Transmembrane protein n=1 Tax=Ameca splendens TaxID=208324 RepID=A0ABV0YMW7_9TELE
MELLMLEEMMGGKAAWIVGKRELSEVVATFMWDASGAKVCRHCVDGSTSTLRTTHSSCQTEKALFVFITVFIVLLMSQIKIFYQFKINGSIMLKTTGIFRAVQAWVGLWDLNKLFDFTFSRKETLFLLTTVQDKNHLFKQYSEPPLGCHFYVF